MTVYKRILKCSCIVYSVVAMQPYKIFSEVSPDQIKHIKDEINEDDDRFKTQIESLKQWMDCHPFLPKNYEKGMLTVFLRSCKHNMEATKRKLELYFINKSKCPPNFKIPQLTDEEKNVFNNGYIVPSTNLTPEGYKVTFFGLRYTDPDACKPEVICKFLWLLALWKANQESLCAGEIMVLDIKFFTPSMVPKLFTPSLHNTVKLLQATFPFRTKKIFAVNVPSFAESFVSVMKVFLSEKIRDRVVVESGETEMRKAIPKECIPSDLGGSDKCIADRMNEWFKLVEFYEPWFKEHEKVQAAIERVPKELYANSGIDDDMGTQGTFRELNVD